MFLRKLLLSLCVGAAALTVPACHAPRAPTMIVGRNGGAVTATGVTGVRWGGPITARAITTATTTRRTPVTTARGTTTAIRRTTPIPVTTTGREFPGTSAHSE